MMTTKTTKDDDDEAEAPKECVRVDMDDARNRRIAL